MSVSIFPPPTSGGGAGGGAETWFYVTANTLSVLTYASDSGSLYRLRAWADDNTTPTVAVNAVTSAGNVVQSFSLVDFDSGSSTNYAEKIFRAAGAIAKYAVTSNKTGYVSFEALSPAVAVTPEITTYTVSQTVTVNVPSSFILLGGGAGSGGSYGGYGGGAGFLTSGTIEPGSYPLVIGAGGAPLSSGGISTFSTFSANGGVGQNGGSGGGAVSNNSWGGGGTNGGNSNNGGGTGSGVTMPYWRTPGAGGGTLGNAGAAGGLYGGGGGASNYADGAGGTGAANTGGGAGGGARNSGGSTGGSGVLFVGVGV